MIDAVSKPNVELFGLHRYRLVSVFEKQMGERDGGHFNAFHSLNNKLIYAAPLAFLVVAASVAFFPVSAISLSIAAAVLGIYGIRVALTVLEQRGNKGALKLCLDDLRRKYIEQGIVEERDIKELVPFADDASLEEMVNGMNETQQLAAYAANPRRVRPLLAHIDKWVPLINFEPTHEDSKENPCLLRVLEIEGRRSFKLPDVNEEWDDLMTEQLDHYYATHTDQYSLNFLVKVLEKHPDCEMLRIKLAVNLLSIDLGSPFFDWKNVWQMQKVVAVKEVSERVKTHLRQKLERELENPGKEFKELYMALKEADELLSFQFNLKNIRPLYELGISAVKQGVLQYVRNNVESIRDSNIWKMDEMPEAIKKVIYPDQFKRYY